MNPNIFVPDNRMSQWGIVLVLALFAAALVLLNPMRQMPLEDDWAYAWTVVHLLMTGDYRLHDWLSANMPFQAYWGLALSKIFGYSFGILRVSTCILSLLGLWAFYGLCREHGLQRDTAAALSLCVATSPLYLRFSLNFMTDVPYLALLTMALCGYTRALRLQHSGWLLAGALAAAAAILTRQFGIAVIGGMVCIWLVDRQRWQHAGWHLAGLLLPCIAAAWQVWQGLMHPNWAATWNSMLQLDFLRSGAGTVLTTVFWRLSVVMHYMAWFLIPLAMLGIRYIIAIWNQEPVKAPEQQGKMLRHRTRTGIGVLAFAFLGALVYGATVREYPWLMPYLPWNFSGLLQSGPYWRLLVTLYTFVGAVVLTYLLFLRYADAARRPGESYFYLLDLTALFSFLGIGIYFQLGDEYCLVLIPFVGIAVARRIESEIQKYIRPFVLGCLLIMGVGMIWTDQILSDAEVRWKAAYELDVQGVNPRDIWVDWMWTGYHRFFEYSDQVEPTPQLRTRDFFQRWLPQQKARAPYWIVEKVVPPPGEEWQVMAEATVKGFGLLAPKRVFAIRRRIAAGTAQE